jgi:hypothetical protein
MKQVSCFLVCLWLGAGIIHAQNQNLRLTLSNVKNVGKEGSLQLYEAKIKVVSDSINADKVQLVFPLGDGKMGFALLETFGERFAPGQSSSFPLSLKTIGFTPADGQTLVSPTLAKAKLPANRTFQFEANEGFIGNEPRVMMTSIKGLQGYAAVGDEFEFINFKGEKGRGKIEGIEVNYGTMTSSVAFEGLPDHTFNLILRIAGDVSFSGVKVYALGTAPASTAEPKPAAASKAKVKTIPVNLVLEDKNLRMTVHNLVKYNPRPDEGIDLFKIDYTLDYYIVDATLENKTAAPLDCGEYLLRFNFFTAAGESADEFTRIFKNQSGNADEVRQNADLVDATIFGGTGKIVMANVLAKYQGTMPDYDAKYKANTMALGKPLAPGQKIRSIDATIMGIPPSYNIQGLGTWTGLTFDKKKFIFVPLKL